MDQKTGAGHHAITRVAVDQLFERMPSGPLLGLNKAEFFAHLDKWQEHADRWHPTLQDAGFGDTWRPSSADPEAQRQHSMADPNKSGEANLRDIRQFVAGNLYLAYAAHATHNGETELQALGAAVHALEDSYSNAHVFRDPTRPDDPHATVHALNNYEPFTHHQTHEKSFDEVPITSGHLERGTDQAAAAAVAEMLSGYLRHLTDDPAQAHQAFVDIVSPFYQGGDHVQIFSDKNAIEYQAERLAHYHNEVSISPAHQPHAADNFTGIDGHTYNIEANVQPTSDRALDAAPHLEKSDAPNPADGSAGHHISHPTAGVHTQVKAVRDDQGHRHFVYGHGGVDGRTASDHASNPHEHQNWQSVNGADIIVPIGTPVYAAFDGTIDSRFGVEHGHEQDGPESMHHGNRLTITGESNSAFYQHLSNFAPGIAPGVQVHAGQLIGYSGIGGGIEHLHVAFQHGDTDQMLREAGSEHDVHAPHPDPLNPGVSGYGADQHHQTVNVTDAQSNMTDAHSGHAVHSPAPDSLTQSVSPYGADHQQQSANTPDHQANITDAHTGQAVYAPPPDPLNPAVSGYGASDHAHQSANVDHQSNLPHAHPGHPEPGQHPDPLDPGASGYGADQQQQSANTPDHQPNMTDAHSGHAVYAPPDPLNPGALGDAADHQQQSASTPDHQANMTDAHTGHAVEAPHDQMDHI